MTSSDGAETSLQPGPFLRPCVSEEQAIDLVSSLYGLRVRSIQELNSYEDRNFHILVEEQHSNEHIGKLWPHGFVLKVLNAIDSQTTHCEAEHTVMKKLGDRGFNCPQPVLNLMGTDLSLESFSTCPTETRINNNTVKHNPEARTGASRHIVRLLTYIPGEIIVKVPYTASLLHNVGQHMGAVQNVLEGFVHPSLENFKTLWNISSVPRIADFLHVVDDPERLHLIKRVLERFQDEVISKQHLFKRGAMHGDYNEQNILVEPVTGQLGRSESTDKIEQHRVYGILDFGNMAYSCYMYEVAIAIMYLMLDSSLIDPMDVGAHLLAGYLLERKLSRVEVDCLPLCIAGRYVQSLVFGCYCFKLDPTNIYALTTAKNGWAQFKELSQTSDLDLLSRWDRIMRVTYDMALM